MLLSSYSFENILYKKEEGIAWITINRPEVLNALDLKTRQEMLKALEDAEKDPSVRVVAITGAGEKAFSAGADLKQIFKESFRLHKGDEQASDRCGKRLSLGRRL